MRQLPIPSFRSAILAMALGPPLGAAAIGCSCGAARAQRTAPEPPPAHHRSESANLSEKPGKKSMDDSFTTYWDKKPVELGVPLRDISPATGRLDVPRAPATNDSTTRGCFVNDSLNSRVNHSVGVLPWRVKWRAKLMSGTTPLCLGGTTDGIVLQALTTWMLWSGGGELVASGAMEASGVTVDPGLSVFLAADHSGLIEGRRLSDGRPGFSLALYYGSDFARTFIARRGRYLFTVSTERPTDPHGPAPERSILEITDLVTPSAPRSYDQPGGPVVVGDLIRSTSVLLAAVQADNIYVATHNRIYQIDLGLKFHAAISGKFTPLAISLDEGGHICLLAETQAGHELWVLNSAGERYYSFRLPPNLATTYPPIIGYDHVVYLIAGEHVLAVDTDGKLNWSHSTTGRVAGAVATPEDVVVGAAGNEIFAYNSKGEKRVLYSAPGEVFATSPMFTSDGDLVVASGSALYRLTSKAD